MRIYLEITNNCNKSCEFCAKSQREKGFLPLQLVRSRIEKIKDFADEVYLHVLGEPLLHKEILKIFSILQEQQVFFKITTNGTLLNDEKITKLLANPYFKQINFSLHALTESEIHGEILERVLEFSKKLMVERNDVFVNSSTQFDFDFFTEYLPSFTDIFSTSSSTFMQVEQSGIVMMFLLSSNIISINNFVS